MPFPLSIVPSIAWGLVWTTTSLSGAEEARLNISLKDRIQVAPGAVYLADVASLRGTDALLLDRVGHLKIGQSPLGAAPVSISRSRLEGFLHRKLLNKVNLRWSGATAVLVQTACQWVTESEIFTAAESALQTDLQAQGMRGHVCLLAPIPPFQVPLGNKLCRIRPQVIPHTLERKFASFRRSIWVDVWVGERLCRSVAVDLRVEGLKPSKVIPGDPEVNLPPLARASVDEHAFSQKSQNLRDPNLVKRGSQAVLRTQVGAITLESKVLVLQDGTRGQRIRVKLPSGTSSIEAQVMGPGQVEVTQ